MSGSNRSPSGGRRPLPGYDLDQVGYGYRRVVVTRRTATIGPSTFQVNRSPVGAPPEDPLDVDYAVGLDRDSDSVSSGDDVAVEVSRELHSAYSRYDGLSVLEILNFGVELGLLDSDFVVRPGEDKRLKEYLSRHTDLYFEELEGFPGYGSRPPWTPEVQELVRIFESEMRDRLLHENILRRRLTVRGQGQGQDRYMRPGQDGANANT